MTDSNNNDDKPYQIVDRPIYHVCIKLQWEAAKEKKKAYFAPTFDADGRITHASMDTSNLVSTCNMFYKTSPGEWICLEMDPNVLLNIAGVATMVEAPMAVGDQAVETATTIRYPHIYGGIATTVPDLITNIYAIKRDPDGTFMSIPGLVES